LAGLADGVLDDELCDVELRLIVVEIENPELIEARAGIVRVVGVGE